MMDDVQMMEDDPVGHDVSVRAIKCEQSFLSRADGSALYSQGGTVVAAGVYGPVESKAQRENASRLCVELNYKPKKGMPGVAERGKEKLIKSACEYILLTGAHPRTSVVITIQEMQDGGGVISSAINATCLALMDSGLPLKCLIAAVSCLIAADGTISVDPGLDRIKGGCVAMLTFAFDNVKRDLILSHCEGRVTREQLSEALRLCRKASTAIFSFYRQAVERKFSKEL